MVPSLRALKVTLLVVTDPGAGKDPEKKAPEEITSPPSAPGEKRLTPESVLHPTNLLAKAPVAPRIPTHLPEEALVVPVTPRIPVVHLVSEAPEEPRIPEATTDTKKTGEESALHLWKDNCNCIVTDHARYCYNCASPLDGERR